MSRRRATLEQIAYGEGTTPGERLKALELLREIEPVELPSEADRALRLALEVSDEAELDRQLDDVIAPVIVEAVESGGGNYPVTRDLLRALAERWAAELADADRLEREVERRAQERAAELVGRQPGLLPVPDTPADGPETAAAVTEAATGAMESSGVASHADASYAPVLAFQ